MSATPARPATGSPSLHPTARAFRVLRWMGLLLAAVVVVDVVLLLLPSQWSDPDWRLATIVQAFGGLPVLAVGLGALTAASAALDDRGSARVLMVVHLLVVLAVVVLLVLFLPTAVRTIAILRDGMISDVGRATVRTVAHAAIFAALHLVLAAVSRRAARPAGTA